MKIQLPTIISNRKKHIEERTALSDKVKTSLKVEGPINFS
jgi:hypothetical protein